MVLGMTGHQDLPRDAVTLVESRIREELQRVTTPHGICSLAAGADQLFARLLIEAGGTLSVIVPCRGYETTFDNATEREAFADLLQRAENVEELPFDEPSDEAFFAAGKRVVDLCDQLLAVWDGLPARGFGGTGDVVAYAKKEGRQVEIIWPTGVAR